MTSRFHGRSVLVCGGATGIGAAIVRRLASEGAAVTIQYRTSALQATALCAELSAADRVVQLVAADLTQQSEVDDLIRSSAFDGLVHSVSAPLPAGRFDHLPWADYQLHFDVAVRSAYLLLRALLASQRPSLRAAVFVLTSGTLSAPPADWAPYLVAKHALWALVRSAAIELGSKGIRVNGVSPAFTRTPLTESIDPRIVELIQRSIPLRRLGTPDDAAAAVAYLLSDDATFVTGINLAVSGGVGV